MVSPARRVARITHHEVVFGDPETGADENFRQSFEFDPGGQARAFRQAMGYLEEGLGDSAADLGAIVLVSVSILPQTRRRGSLSELSANQQKRYRGSRQAKEEARQHAVSLEEWYQIAPDLLAFRGHAPHRPVKTSYVGVAYNTYIANETPTGKAAPEKSKRELSQGVKQAYKRRKRNERRRAAYAARKGR